MKKYFELDNSNLKISKRVIDQIVKESDFASQAKPLQAVLQSISSGKADIHGQSYSRKEAAACKSDSPLFVFYAFMLYANGFSVLYGTLAG